MGRLSRYWGGKNTHKRSEGAACEVFLATGQLAELNVNGLSLFRSLVRHATCAKFTNINSFTPTVVRSSLLVCSSRRVFVAIIIARHLRAAGLVRPR